MPLATASTAVYSKLATGASSVRIDLEEDDDDSVSDRAALLGAPSEEDLEVGRINDRRHLNKSN